MTRLGRGRPEKMARSGWVLADRLAGKLNICVSNEKESKTISLHTDAECWSLQLESYSTHSSSNSFSIP